MANSSPTAHAEADFEMELTPGEPLVSGTGRFDLRKTWTGAMVGESVGVMLSAGDPASGHAGYVALETFDGALDGRRGGFALQQYGVMAGSTSLSYGIVPGSGSGELSGITGSLKLTITEAGHHVEVTYEIP